MKIFLGLVLVGALALAGWLLFGRDTSEVAQSTPTPLTELSDETPTPIVSEEPFVTQSVAPTVTPVIITVRPTVRPPTPTPTPQGTPSPLFATINPLNASGEAGVVAITKDASGRAVVWFNLNGGPVNVPQPAYIYRGTCNSTQEIVYVLNPVVNGGSSTTLTTSWDDMWAARGTLAIVVHASASDSLRFACGNIQ